MSRRTLKFIIFTKFVFNYFLYCLLFNFPSFAMIDSDMRIYLREDVRRGADKLREDILEYLPLGSDTERVLGYLAGKKFHCQLISPTHHLMFRNKYFCSVTIRGGMFPAVASVLLSHSEGKITDVEVTIRYEK